jgi:hypothetical protein
VSLLSQKEVLNLKLSCILLPQLRMLAQNLGINDTGSATEIIKGIFEKQADEKIIDEFIKQRYAERIQERRTISSDEALKKELMKVKTL